MSAIYRILPLGSRPPQKKLQLYSLNNTLTCHHKYILKYHHNTLNFVSSQNILKMVDKGSKKLKSKNENNDFVASGGGLIKPLIETQRSRRLEFP